MLATLVVVFRSAVDRTSHTQVSPPRRVPLVWTVDPRPSSRGGGQAKRAPTHVVERPVTAAPPPVVTIEPPTIAPEPEPQVVANVPQPGPAVPENGDART